MSTRSASRAALHLPGLCPLCGGSAMRGVTYADGLGVETYRCPVDGETRYLVGEVRAFGVEGVEAMEEPFYQAMSSVVDAAAA